MADPTERPTTLRLAASVVLGAVAGFVDAICFARLFDVFPANQSGNAILLGIGLGDGSATEVWRPATAMIGFAVGVAGAVLVRRSGRIGRPARALIAAEIVLLAVVALTVGSLLEVTRQLGGASGAALLLASALAMGVQTEVIRSHAGVSIATTYQTGALTRLAEGAAGGPTPRAPTDRPAEEPPRAVTAIVILTSVLVGYIGGAAAGAHLADEWGAALAVPLAALFLLLLSEGWWSASRT